MDLTQDEIIEKLDSGEIRIYEIEKYTKTAIEKNVLQCLDQQETILGSNYYDQNKDFVHFLF